MTIKLPEAIAAWRALNPDQRDYIVSLISGCFRVEPRDVAVALLMAAAEPEAPRACPGFVLGSDGVRTPCSMSEFHGGPCRFIWVTP